MKSRISLILMVLLYTGAGINHFWHPLPYLKLIPNYLPYPQLINYTSGSAEFILGMLLIFSATRKYAAYGIILLLVAFIPAHIYMIQIGWCTAAGYCFPAWVVWVRLFPVQFILMWWAWRVGSI